MTIINPKSIAGVTSITTASGADNLLTVHTNNTTERVRINNDGDVIVGSGITVSPDGDIFATGVTTATTFSGSGASLTNLPAANLTGTLPAISGANLTNLDASDLASGTVPTARLGSGTASSSTFLRGDSTFAAVTSTTINSNADNRVITGSGTADTLNGESNLTFDGNALTVTNSSSNTAATFQGAAGAGFIAIKDGDDSTVAYIGVDGGNLKFQTSGSSYSDKLLITTDGKFGFNNTSPSAAIELSFDSGGSAPSSGTAPEGIAISYGTADNKNGGIWFSPGFGDDQGISGINGNRTSGYDTDLRFYTNSTNSARAFSERMRIDPNGKVGINDSAPDTAYRCTIKESTSGHGVLVLDRTSNIDGTLRSMVSFERNGTAVGTILCSNSATQYNTSSDYRLKENATAISDGITRLKTLKPYRFNFKVNPSTTVDGFFAHEVTAVPEAISGTKDEVDSDNNPVYQGIDQAKLVPLLTAALQEAVTKIEVLETRLNNAGIAT